MDDERAEQLDELYELYSNIDKLELKIERLEIKFDDNTDKMILAEINILKDNIKDNVAEYEMLEEEIQWDKESPVI